MTDQQVLRYTQLCKRRMDILLHSGASWLPEYEAELKHRPGIKRAVRGKRSSTQGERKESESMKARALLIEALVGIASAAVAAGAFCWMVKYTVLKEADMIVIAAFLWLWVACKLLVWANRRNTHVA